MIGLAGAHAAHADYNLVSVGPSFGTVTVREEGDTLMAYSLDVTLSEGNVLRELFTPWISVGTRIAAGNHVFPYAELGINMFVNIGAGYGGVYNGDDGYRQCAHIFFGVPVPLMKLGNMEDNRGFMYVPYFEPYYRPVFSLGRELLFHEFGCLVKVALWF